MKLKINIVDAFTDKQFRGNSAAVIITDSWLDDELMQSIAMENSLSETAFLVPRDDASYQIRWFSPIEEVDFCGHATLASSYVIFSNHPQIEQIDIFAQEVGTMHISKMQDGSIQMDFPKRKPTPVQGIPCELLDGLSIAPSRVLVNNQAYFAVYEDEQDVINVEQDRENIRKLYPRDVVVTAQSTSSDYDCVSRYFWPASGGDEDPVTGSIHTGLAPYWGEILGKSELVAYQASKRGGVLRCRIEQDRVFISGNAVHYLQGYISVQG